MRTFDRYLLSQLLMLFGFFSLVLVAVYWVNRAVSLFDRLVAGGQNLAIFFEFTALALPQVISAVLPVSALVATIYAVNRLNQDSELVVAQTSGIGPWSLARPVAFFAILVILIVGTFTHGLVPSARTALGDRTVEVSRDVTARFLIEGEFLHPAKDVTVYVREITEAGELRGLLLQDRRSAESQTTYTAETALLVQTDGTPRLIMLSGMAQTLRREGNNLTVVNFDDFTYDLADLSVAGPRSRNIRELSSPELWRADAALKRETGASQPMFNTELHARMADPLFSGAVVIMALGMMLLGRYSRFGLWRQIFAVIVLAVLIQLAGNVAQANALKKEGAWPTVYLAPAFTLSLGLGALWLASRGGFRPTRGAAGVLV